MWFSSKISILLTTITTSMAAQQLMPLALSLLFFSDVMGGGSVFDEVGLPDFAPPAVWFMNEGNYVFASDGPWPNRPRVNDAANGVQMNIASWSNPVAVASEPAQAAPSVPVPTLPSFLLVALGGLLALFGIVGVRVSK